MPGQGVRFYCDITFSLFFIFLKWFLNLLLELYRVAQISLEFGLVPPPPECWDYKSID